jgi:hypothetical protein
MVSVSHARPKISNREERSGLKLLPMPEFVQEQRGARRDVGSEEDPSPQRDRRDRGTSERPPAHARREAAAAETQVAQFRVPSQHLFPEELRLPNQGGSDTVDDAHRSPCA